MDWKEFIQCAVCLRPFDGSHLPVSLICGHTICTPCIQACSGSSSGSQHSSFPWSSSRSDSPAREAQSLQYDNGIENITPENHGKKVPMQGLRNYQCPLDQTVHKVPLTNLPVNSSLVHLLRLEARNSSQENHGNVVQNPFNGNAEQRGFERDRLSPLHRCPSAPESLVLRNPASHASPRQFNPSPLSYTHSSSAMDSAGWLQNAQFGRSNSSNVQNGGFASAREQRSLDTGRMPLSLQNSQESSFSTQSRSVEYSSIPPFRAWEGQSALSHALFALESGNMMAGGEADIMDEKAAYEAALASLDQLAAAIGSLDSGAGVPSQILNKPLQRKILALLQCQIAFPEGRSKCLRAVRSVCERVVMELIIQHQNQQQLTSHLWSAVRARGCQFLGPAMQEEVLKLVLLALETGSALSRKVLVMFIVQKLKPQYSQASKTSVGHVVQLLYRASCFKVSKRDGDSSLMELKEEFRNYDALRKEHDAQIIQIAQEAGLRIAPEQWSALLYGDHLHKSHMQSIIDKLQSAQFFAQSVQELLIAVQRSGDTGNLCRLRGPLDQVAGLALDNPNQNGEERKKDAPSMQLTAISIHSAVQVVTAFLAFMGNAMIRREMMSAARIRSLNTPISGLGTPTSENGKMIQPLALQAHLSTVHPAFVHPQIAAHRALSATRSLPHSHAALQSQNSLPLFAPFPHSQTHFHMPSGENRPPLADLAYQTHGGVAMSNQSRHPLTRMTGVPDFARSVPDAQFRLARSDGGGMDGMGPSRMLGRTISRQVSVPGSGLDTFNSQMQNSAALYGKSALADDHSGRTSSLEDDFYSAQLRLHPVSGASDFDGFHRNSRPLQGSLSSPFTSAWPTESYRNPENNNMMFHVGDKNSPPEGKLGSSYDGPSSFMPDYSQRPPPGLNSLLNSRRLPSSSGSLLDEFARWRDDASTSQGMHRISSLSSDLGNMRLSRSAVFHDEYSNPSALDFPYPSLATKQTSFAPPSSSAHSASSHSGPHSETSASLANRFQGVSNGELDGHDENGHWAASCLFSLSDDDPSVDA